MNKLLLAICLIPSLATAANSTQITGAGSSFIYPVLSKWSQDYNKATGVKINYQPIGSGGGISQLTNGTVDFAASDKPLQISELNNKKWQQFPAVVGGIVPVINISGIKNNQLVLSGPILSEIYSGKITYWDNTQITKLNKKLKLPHARIISIHRADGSGTTFNFTKYLSDIDQNWHKNIGYETVVKWPSFGLGAKGNAGVAAQVKILRNSIGYVEYAYAHSSNLTMAKMINKSGKVVSADINSFKSAAQNANWQSSNAFYLILTNQPGAGSWPIVATTFVLLPKKASATRQATIKFFNWIFANGNKTAQALDYVSIPKTVSAKISKYLQSK